MLTRERRAQGIEMARRFVDAFNRRDADGLLALCDPEIEFRPTMLVGEDRVYRGRDGVRRWVEELLRSDAQHRARIREIRMVEEDRLIVLTDVMLDDEAITPSAMVAKLRDGRIVEVRAYLSDEDTLAELDLLR